MEEEDSENEDIIDLRHLRIYVQNEESLSMFNNDEGGTMLKFRDQLGGTDVLIFVDSGSSINFISNNVGQKLQPLAPRFKTGFRINTEGMNANH